MHRLTLIAILLLAGCGNGNSGPPSTRADSSQFAALSQRQAFVENYVSFRRTYKSLDFSIFYANGGGTSPSEWDVRLIAVVPADQIDAWTTGLSPATTADRDWLTAVPTTLDLTGVTEWHTAAHRIVGLDRTRRIVVYRNEAH